MIYEIFNQKHLQENVITIMIVYKIPYRRAPRLAYRPLGRVRRASKGILHTTIMIVKVISIDI